MQCSHRPAVQKAVRSMGVYLEALNVAQAVFKWRAGLACRLVRQKDGKCLLQTTERSSCNDQTVMLAFYFLSPGSEVATMPCSYMGQSLDHYELRY